MGWIDVRTAADGDNDEVWTGIRHDSRWSHQQSCCMVHRVPKRDAGSRTKNMDGEEPSDFPRLWPSSSHVTGFPLLPVFHDRSFLNRNYLTDLLEEFAPGPHLLHLLSYSSHCNSVSSSHHFDVLNVLHCRKKIECASHRSKCVAFHISRMPPAVSHAWTSHSHAAMGYTASATATVLISPGTLR